jgi:DNA polymerase zeta
MFILFENISKAKAFEVSHKIVSDISNMYKKPVKLKFEKIYHPCVLISKKRYVGYSYETITQLEPVLDAKGIEVIRRDGCQVGSKILERCLKILFEFKEPEKVKNFILRQCNKITQGKVNLKEFIIAKEYRGRETYSNVKSVAACQIANRNLTKDPLAEPLTGERVPYLIALGPPGSILIIKYHTGYIYNFFRFRSTII